MITVTLRMLGSPRIKLLTATYSPLFREISLRMRKTLKALKSLENGVIDMIEKMTIKKSRRFQVDLK